MVYTFAGVFTLEEHQNLARKRLQDDRSGVGGVVPRHRGCLIQ